MWHAGKEEGRPHSGEKLTDLNLPSPLPALGHSCFLFLGTPRKESTCLIGSPLGKSLYAADLEVY